MTERNGRLSLTVVLFFWLLLTSLSAVWVLHSELDLLLTGTWAKADFSHALGMGTVGDGNVTFEGGVSREGARSVLGQVDTRPSAGAEPRPDPQGALEHGWHQPLASGGKGEALLWSSVGRTLAIVWVLSSTPWGQWHLLTRGCALEEGTAVRLSQPAFPGAGGGGWPSEGDLGRAPGASARSEVLS